MILWMTGLSGSGKSVYAKYLKESHGFIVLDGDELRAGLCKDLGYDTQSKIENGRRMIELCKLLSDQDVVVSTVTAYEGNALSGRMWVRRELPDAKMIWVKASIETCKERDPKGIYKMNPPYLPGVSALWEDPVKFDLCLDTENNSIDYCCGQIDEFLRRI